MAAAGRKSSLSKPNKEKQPALFSEPDKTSDIVFIVEDQKIHFTKAFLIACSPVFERMFESDFAEKNAREIPLPDKKHKEIVEFFKQIHPAYGPSSTVRDDSLMCLLDLSREYQVDGVHRKCERFIDHEMTYRDEMGMWVYHNQDLSIERVMLFLYASEQHDFKQFMDILKDIASKNRTKDIEQSPYFKLLQPTTVADVFRARCKRLET